MSLESVRAFLAAHAPDIAIIETAASTATVAEAAAAHGVAAGQIAKTLSLAVRDEVVLLVLAGDVRLDNRKLKDTFKAKPSMLAAEAVAAVTGHPLGGVCPFGLARPLAVYADVSLRRFAEVIPAAGAINAALRIAPERLVQLCAAQWVDVAQGG
jgi:prolyl-tRNA editing enzyme YbaK/EbsC (Cys-tRNA(Pro) deacylase)